ncbi:sigma-70 family RNA polymerase sigma factor [Altererythrobacter sp. Z27]|uniref:sigma-70 family RNA polymerase sigma factor n=1 Tax=Altererythrobacter sp. Z27 TaxID=3461147 RepID=UPI004043D7C2
MMQPASGLGIKLLVRTELVEAAEWRNFRQNPCPETKIRLFDRYSPFARTIARMEWRKLNLTGLESSDAEQVAHEALLASIERYDPARGVPFKAYVRQRLRGAVRNEWQRTSEAAAIAGYRARVERDRIRSIRSTSESSPDDAIAQLRELAVGIAIGLILEADPKDRIDQLPDREPSAYDELAWRQMLGELGSRIAQLPDRERLVLDYHYRQDIKFKEIAGLLGLSKGRVSQIHAQALQRLRRALQKFR